MLLQSLQEILCCHAGECDNIAGELAEAQGISAELSKERDELAACFANLEAEHANLGNAHTSLKYAASLEPCTSHIYLLVLRPLSKFAGCLTECALADILLPV